MLPNRVSPEIIGLSLRHATFDREPELVGEIRHEVKDKRELHGATDLCLFLGVLTPVEAYEVR